MAAGFFIPEYEILLFGEFSLHGILTGKNAQMIFHIREAHENDKTTADEGNVPTVESVKQLYSKAKANPTVDTVFDIGSGNRKNPL